MPWLRQALRTTPGLVAGTFVLSLTGTAGKLNSIVSGVVAIQAQLGQSGGAGPYSALVPLLPSSAPWVFLLVSVVSAMVAVVAELGSQRLRARAAEVACGRWLLRSLEDIADPAVAFADVGRVARSTTYGLVAGTAGAEMVAVLAVLAVVHPAAALAGLPVLIGYLLLSSLRDDSGTDPDDWVPARTSSQAAYGQLLQGLPAGSTARQVLLARIAQDPLSVAPARQFLADLRVRTRQATEAPLFLAAMIGALYVLALLERSEDPLAGAANLVLSVLLLRLVIGGIIRLRRAQTGVRGTWLPGTPAPPVDDALSGSVAGLPSPTAVYGTSDKSAAAAVQNVRPDLSVLVVGSADPVGLGIPLQDLLADRTTTAQELASRLGVDLHDSLQADAGEVGLPVRLVALLSQRELGRTALLLPVTAWSSLEEPVQQGLLRAVALLLLVHPTPRSQVPPEVTHVLVVGAEGRPSFSGSRADYLAAKPWQQRRA